MIPIGMVGTVGNGFFVLEELSREEYDFDIPEIGMISGIIAVFTGLLLKAGRRN